MLRLCAILLLGCFWSISVVGQTYLTSEDSVRVEREFRNMLHSYFSWQREEATLAVRDLTGRYHDLGHLSYLKAWMLIESGDYLGSLEAATEGTTLQDEHFSAFYDLLSINFYHNMAVGAFSLELDRRAPEEIDIFKVNVLRGPDPEDQLLQLGITLLRRDQDSAAYITLQQALRLRFDYGEAHRVLAEMAADRSDFQSAAIGYVLLMTTDESSPHIPHLRLKLLNALIRSSDPENPASLASEIPRSLIDSFIEACAADSNRLTVPLYRELCSTETFIKNFRLALLSAADQPMTYEERQDLRIWRDNMTDSLRTAYFGLHGLVVVGGEVISTDPDSTSESGDPNHNSVPLPANYQE